MNSDTFKGRWRQMSGGLREAWGRLTHDEPTQTAGQLERLIGEAQFCYGLARAAARRRQRMLQAQ